LLDHRKGAVRWALSEAGRGRSVAAISDWPAASATHPALPPSDAPIHVSAAVRERSILIRRLRWTARSLSFRVESA
jgi:hypothetical protein